MADGPIPLDLRVGGMQESPDAESTGGRKEQHPYDQQEKEHVFHGPNLVVRSDPVKDGSPVR